ncbi:MAG TPA: DUF418 domain-containing protein [Chitinophagaceae bacterium]|nr:DUF418 domain-containing protein [Chitinophagaceae bacterium]
MRKEKIGPVAIQERIQTIDIIRGFALFGILVINFTVDHGLTEPWAGFTGFMDQLVYWFVAFFMNDKFLATYAFLFGLGFSLQMLRAEERNSPFVFVYIRRLFVLYIIGVIHQILTAGDILRDYAMAGVLLLILHKLPRKLLPVLAILCFLVPWTRGLLEAKNITALPNHSEISVDTAILDTYVGVYPISPEIRQIFIRKGNKLIGEGPGKQYLLIAKSDSEFIRPDVNTKITFMKDSAGIVNRYVTIDPNGVKNTRKKIKADLQLALAEQLRQRAARRTGEDVKTYKQFVTRNFNGYWQSLKNWSWKNYFWGFSINGILPLFLMGLYFGRRKIFYDIPVNRSFLRNVMKWGLLIGLTSSGIALGFDAWNYFNDIKNESYSLLTRHLINAAWDFLGIMGMALGYIAGMALLLEKVNWKKRLSFLGPIGRMGLTNYLLQASVISITIDSYGFGLNGKAGPAWRLLMALVTFVLIALISRWWFKHFRIGPAEWLWRSLTYLKIQPMRLKSSDKNGMKIY